VFLEPLPELAKKTFKMLPIVSNPDLGFTVLCLQPLLNFVEGNVMRAHKPLEKVADRQQIAPLVWRKQAPR